MVGVDGCLFRVPDRLGQVIKRRRNWAYALIASDCSDVWGGLYRADSVDRLQ
jgi:hypothetical protein